MPLASQPKPVRAWQRMLSGRRLDLLDPSPLDIEVEDIAHGLARVARWNGQTAGSDIFSVVAESLIEKAIGGCLDSALSNPDRLALLLHDAPEYVIGDIISPFKAVIGDAYKGVEARLLAAIHIRFGLPAEPGPAIKSLAKQADRIAAFLEATRLAGFSREEALQFFGRPVPLPAEVDALLTPWPIERSKRRYAARLEALWGA